MSASYRTTGDRCQHCDAQGHLTVLAPVGSPHDRVLRSHHRADGTACPGSGTDHWHEVPHDAAWCRPETCGGTFYDPCPDAREHAAGAE